MPESMRPKSRRDNRTVPRVAVEAADFFFDGFKQLVRDKLALLDELEFDLKLDPDVSSAVLHSLQKMPKPGRGYELTITVNGKDEKLEVEPITRTSFRIVRRSKVPPVLPKPAAVPPRKKP